MKPETLPQEASDEELLAALDERLSERRGALEQAAQVLAQMRAVNAKLEAAERLKGRFLSNIRNEINNPLTAVRGFSAALASTPDLPPDRVAGIAATIYREVSELSFQMQNIFAAADLEAGASAPDFARVNMNTLVAEVVADFESLAEYRNIRVSAELGEPTVVFTDPAKFALIFANLLRNALEFARSQVVVRLNVGDGTLILDVLDDGPGIAAADAPRIFDRFVQLSEGSTKAHPGHGLGLSVARACADLIGGSLDMITNSEAGAHFRLQIAAQSSEPGVQDAEGMNQFLFEAIETF